MRFALTAFALVFSPFPPLRTPATQARISLGKQNVDCVTGKLINSKQSQVTVAHLLVQTTSRQLVLTLNGTLLNY